MKRIHLLRVEAEAEAFEPLIAALRRDGGRVGWLDVDLADPVPPALAGAAALDVLRAVAIGPHLSLAVKPRRGAPVLRDVLREHFRGCRLVLVAGGTEGSGLGGEAPLLAPDGDGWSVRAAGSARTYSTDELVRALRKPKGFT